MLANLNLDLAYLLARGLGHLPNTKINRARTRGRAIQELSRNKRVVDAVAILQEKPSWISVNLGIVLDAFITDFPTGARAWAIIIIAQRFKCSLEDAMRNYEIVICPHHEAPFQGLLFVRRKHIPSAT